jgi:hypothetical protein
MIIFSLGKQVLYFLLFIYASDRGSNKRLEELYNEEFHNLLSPPNVLMMKSCRVG